MAPLYLALLHFPVYDKNGQVVTTAVTHLDIHDIARSACTYGVRRPSSRPGAKSRCSSRCSPTPC